MKESAQGGFHVGVSIWQILIVVGLVLLVFGPSRLPGLGKSMGEAIRGFKKGVSEDEIDVTESSEKIEKKEDENNKA
jgi:sec-independent protein translocase protein TatA